MTKLDVQTYPQTEWILVMFYTFKKANFRATYVT